MRLGLVMLVSFIEANHVWVSFFPSQSLQSAEFVPLIMVFIKQPLNLTYFRESFLIRSEWL